MSSTAEKHAPSHWPLLGMGLCWAAEEIFTLCITVGPSGVAQGSQYLYLFYLPFYALGGAALASIKKTGDWLENPSTQPVLILLGVIGVLTVALFRDATVAVMGGTLLFTVSAIALNYLWFKAISGMASHYASRTILVTAATTTTFTFVQALPLSAALLFAAALLVASFATYIRYQTCRGAFLPEHKPKPTRTLAKKPLAVLGVCVLTTSFAFLQYSIYHYASPAIPYAETISHLIALALLAAVLFVRKDHEHTFAMKLSTTLMLFAFVLFSVFQGLFSASVIIAASTEGLLELVIFLALAEVAGYSTVRPSRLMGCYMLLIGCTQLIGCGLSIVEHAYLPPSDYSIFGLGLVALLIVTAVWFLNDKTITAFLWGNAPIKKETDAAGNAVSEKTAFDEKARRVAQAYNLTQRETDVLIPFSKGRSSSFIAEQFFVSNNTVRSHILHIYSKCNVHSRQELITLIDEWDARPAGSASFEQR